MALFCIRKYHILCIAKGVRPKSIFRKWKIKSLCDIQKPCEREEKSQRKDQLLSENMCMRMLLLCFAPSWTLRVLSFFQFLYTFCGCCCCCDIFRCHRPTVLTVEQEESKKRKRQKRKVSKSI